MDRRNLLNPGYGKAFPPTESFPKAPQPTPDKPCTGCAEFDECEFPGSRFANPRVQQPCFRLPDSTLDEGEE